MPPPAKQHSKSKVGRRRAHLAKTASKLVACAKCKKPSLTHRVCPHCGFAGRAKEKEKS